MALFGRRSKRHGPPEQFLAQLGPDDDFVRQVGRPGERFWTGLPSLYWDAYERTLAMGGRELAIESAMCLLVPTSQRIFIMNKATGRILRIELGNLTSADVYEDEALGPSRAESFLTLRLQEHGEPSEMKFTAKTDEAKLFQRHILALKDVLG